MLRSFKKYIVLLTLVLVFIPNPLQASKIDDLKASITERNNQLAEIQKEINAFEQQLEEVGRDKDTLKNAIKVLNITRSKLVADINGIQVRINTETLNIEKLNLEISDKEQRIVLNNKAIAEALRKVRETDSITMIEGVLSKQNLSDFWETYEALESFQEGIKEDLAKLRNTKVALSKDKTEVEVRRSSLVSQRSQLGDKRAIVDQNKREQNKLLDVTESKEENYENLLAEKVKQREQFERELFEFESQLQFELDPTRLPPSGKGVLAWPLTHIRITQKFGKTADSGRLYTSGTHNGVDFGISTGTNVMSALSGVVMGVGNTDRYPRCLSYGRWVLIKHNNGLSTLYAHLSGTAVSVGQSVSTGQVLGYSGNTGYSTGPHLHLSLFASQGVELVRLGDIKTITNCADAVIPIAPRDAYLDPLIYL